MKRDAAWTFVLHTIAILIGFSSATYAQSVLSGTVTGCQRDAFGAASGPNRPLSGVRVLVGQYMNYETGLTGVDFIKNPKGVFGDTTTNEEGNFTVTLPKPGVYEVVLWKRGYVTEITSKVGIGAAATFHGSICDNIMAPATHQELAFIGGPPIEKPAVFWKNGNDGGIEGGNGTPPKVSLDRAYYITEIYTYHWNGGQGQPIAGTIALRGADGTTYGPWQVEIYNKVYWRASPNAIIPAGTYTLIDSDPKTWAQNSGSKGTGQGWASGTPAKDENSGLADPSKSADATKTVSPSPSSGKSESGVAEWAQFHLSYTISGADLEPRETVSTGAVQTYHYAGKLAGNTLTISGRGWGDVPVSAPNYPWVVSASVSVDGNTREFEYKAITPGEKLNKSFSISVPIPANASSGSISIKVLYHSAYRIQGNAVTGTFTRSR
jgi:hypothetical protein